MKTILPSGTYYIGDPCYAFDSSWSEILDKTNFFNETDTQHINDYKIAVGSTAYGDGIYKDQEGYEYPVDAGMIGALPIELLELDKKLSIQEVIDNKYGRIITFNEKTTIYIHDGKFHFGNIYINTN